MKQPLDHLRSRKKPVSRRVPIALDSELAERYDEVRQRGLDLGVQLQLEQAKRQPNQGLLQDIEDKMAELKEEEAAAEAALKESTAIFLVKSIGPQRYERMVTEHAPTPDQVKKYRKENTVLNWNPDTFPNALIAACCSYIQVTPDGSELPPEPLTLEFVKEMQESDDWNSGEILELFQAALNINSAVRQVANLGNG